MAHEFSSIGKCSMILLTTEILNGGNAVHTSTDLRGPNTPSIIFCLNFKIDVLFCSIGGHEEEVTTT